MIFSRYVSNAEFPHDYYNDYCSGLIIIIPRQLIKKMFQSFKNTTFSYVSEFDFLICLNHNRIAVVIFQLAFFSLTTTIWLESWRQRLELNLETCQLNQSIIKWKKIDQLFYTGGFIFKPPKPLSRQKRCGTNWRMDTTHGSKSTKKTRRRWAFERMSSCLFLQKFHARPVLKRDTEENEQL